MDWNVQCDTFATRLVATHADLTLVPVPVAAAVHLRRAHLPRLRAAGPVGALLARQSEAHAADAGLAALAAAHDGLPDDLVNFHWDPLTAAVALGWPGAGTERLRLTPAHTPGGNLVFEPDPAGRPATVVTRVDAAAFAETWLSAIEAIGGPD